MDRSGAEMKIVVADKGLPLPGTLVYRVDELSFDTEPRPAGAVASLTINEVELMLGEDGAVLFVSGYSPFHGWKSESLNAPRSRDGRLVVATPISTGTGISLDEGRARWDVQWDPSTGLVRFGRNDSASDSLLIRFAPGGTAELRGDKVCALWLQPESPRDYRRALSVSQAAAACS